MMAVEIQRGRMEEAWLDFQATVLPAGTSDAMLRAYRMIFFSGALAMRAEGLSALGGPDGAARWQALEDEMQAFVARLDAAPEVVS